jgi:hypothetical protein
MPNSYLERLTQVFALTGIKVESFDGRRDAVASGSV